MQQTDFKRFAAVMNGMAKLYERELDTVVLDAYWLALRGWPLNEFEAGAAHLMQHSKWMPRPADFSELRKAARPTIGEAWAKAISSCHSAWTPQGYFGGTSGDPLIDRVVRAIGGYATLAQCEQDKLHFLERRFNEIYDGVQEAEDVRAALPQLAPPRNAHGKLSGLLPIGVPAELDP